MSHKAITEQEITEYLRAILDGKEVYMFVRTDASAEIYKRLNFMEYLTTVLTDSTAVIEDPQKPAATGKDWLKRDFEQEKEAKTTLTARKEKKETSEMPKKPIKTGTGAVSAKLKKRKTAGRSKQAAGEYKYAELDKGRARALFNAGWPKDEIVKDLYNQNPEEVAAEVDRLEAERNERIQSI